MLQAHPKLSPLLRLESVGVFAGSAGGHTALPLAGGEWSASRFRDHCLKNIADGFSSCVGLTTRLRGTWLDGLKLFAAKLIIRWKFDDETVQRYKDHRIRAAVAMVPFAADFAPETLRIPAIRLGLVIAERDVNQVPVFHVKAIQAVCEPRCQVLATLSEAGHRAMLSPVPPLEPGSIAEQFLSDPPLFARANVIPELHETVANFFLQKFFAE